MELDKSSFSSYLCLIFGLVFNVVEIFFFVLLVLIAGSDSMLTLLL